MATLGDIRDSVLVKLAHLNDGAVDPALLESVERTIRSSVAQLQDDYPVRLLKTRGEITWASGVQEMTAPTDLEIGRELGVWWRSSSAVRPYNLQPMIEADTEATAPASPLYYEIARMTRWDDEQVVTTTVIRVDPIPSNGGTLLIDYTRAQPEIEDEDTEIVLDAELVAIDAALALVDTVAPQQRKTLEVQWSRHSANNKSKQSGGRDLSFSPWRRRAD